MFVIWSLLSMIKFLSCPYTKRSYLQRLGLRSNGLNVDLRACVGLVLINLSFGERYCLEYDTTSFSSTNDSVLWIWPSISGPETTSLVWYNIHLTATILNSDLQLYSMRTKHVFPDAFPRLYLGGWLFHVNMFLSINN